MHTLAVEIQIGNWIETVNEKAAGNLYNRLHVV